MNILKRLSIVCVTLWAAGAAAQQDLSGTWQGKLAVAADTTLTIQFTFTRQPDGSWGAVLNSPDTGGIKNVAANAVRFDGSAVAVEVAELSGSYAGTLKDGAIDGTWSQEGSDLPLALAPYEAPVLSQAAKDTLSGSWFGPLAIPGASITMTLRFEANDKGEFVGMLASPDQGGGEIAVENLEFADNLLSFKVPRARGEYTGTYANDEFTGTWKQAGPAILSQGVQLVLKRGEYAPRPVVLELSMEQFAQLSGTWTGKLGPLNIVVRFGTDASGNFVGFVDSPDQGAKDLKITEAALADGKLSFKLAVPPAEYSGDLSGNTVTGAWTQMGQANPLVLTRQQ